MSAIDCGACDELRETSPDFAQNGVTKAICNSLQNDTGLNPSLGSLHTDCEDLDMINDCLVGRMGQEIEAYEVCDWKTYMRKFVGNLYEFLKALICAICGIWKNIHRLDDKTDEMCAMIENVFAPPVTRYGSVPNGDASRRCGTIGEKNGNPLLIPYTYDERGHTVSWPSQNAGLRYGKRASIRCVDGSCLYYEWLMPDFFYYKLSQDAEYGDIVWYCTVTEARNIIGISDYLLNMLELSAYGWQDFHLSAQRKEAWFRLSIDADGPMGDQYITVSYQGTSYPNDGILTRDDEILEPSNSYKLWRHNC